MKKASLFICIAFLISCDSMYDGGANYAYDNFGVYNEEGETTEKYTNYGENPFINTSDENQSTFGVDADGASYSNARRFLNLGQLPPTSSVRVEEFINYFSFDYPAPSTENVSIYSETAQCPWNENHLLLQIGLKGMELDESKIGPSNFVFLIDVSGSMSTPDKLEMLKTGFEMLVDEMDEQDRIAIVTYASADKVVLNSTPCDEKSKIKKAIGKLGSGGSTAGAKGIITAYEIAQENFIEGGNNRIIVGSDGDFNVGPASNEELVELIEKKRDTGIFLTVLGVGQGNLNDSMMEQLANNGNGNYEYIDNVDQLKKVFINEKQKFYTVAKDCKIQITFNESNIDSFRLIGYENRVLNNEDFEKDTVDAGEIGANQSITAFYELVPKPESSGSYCNVDFRYKKPNEDNSRLMDHEVNYEISTFENTSSNFKFACSLAGYGLLLKNSEFKGTLSFDMVKGWINQSNFPDEFGYKDEFAALIDVAQELDRTNNQY